MTAFGVPPDWVGMGYLAADWGVPYEVVERAVYALEALYEPGGVHRSNVEAVRGVVLDSLRRMKGGGR